MSSQAIFKSLSGKKEPKLMPKTLFYEEGQGFKPSAAHLYSNIGWATPPPTPHIPTVFLLYPAHGRNTSAEHCLMYKMSSTVAAWLQEKSWEVLQKYVKELWKDWLYIVLVNSSC